MNMTDPSGVAATFRGLTIERLESFLAGADAGGIARAATGNPSRQSQLSRQLREVSEALGFEVMERRGRGMVLTEAGVRVRAVLRELVAGLDAVRAERAAAPAAATLVAGDSVLRWLVLPHVYEVLARAPGVDLAVRAVTTGFNAVRDGDVDFAVARRRRPTPPGMTASRLGTLRYALFAPTGSSTAGARAIAELPFVHVTGSSETMRKFTETLGYAPRVALRCETFPQAALAVASGRYAAVLPALAARDIPARVAAPVPVAGIEALNLQFDLVARLRRLEAVPALEKFHAQLARLLARLLAA
jgi:DNA-binding transcriptional LysR family regulator